MRIVHFHIIQTLQWYSVYLIMCSQIVGGFSLTE